MFGDAAMPIDIHWGKLPKNLLNNWSTLHFKFSTTRKLFSWNRGKRSLNYDWSNSKKCFLPLITCTYGVVSDQSASKPADHTELGELPAGALCGPKALVTDAANLWFKTHLVLGIFQYLSLSLSLSVHPSDNRYRTISGFSTLGSTSLIACPK